METRGATRYRERLHAAEAFQLLRRRRACRINARAAAADETLWERQKITEREEWRCMCT